VIRQDGRHERLHLTLKKEATKSASKIGHTVPWA